MTNKARKENDLKPLTPDPRLFEAARKHSANMARQNKMDHILDGKNPFDRIKAAGYKYGYAGENVAFGNIPIEETFKGWMDSPPHRKNILSPHFTQIGLGRVENAEGIAYYTQVFGSPRP
jgi:uncharacterized protein YkwD